MWEGESLRGVGGGVKDVGGGVWEVWEGEGERCGRGRVRVGGVWGGGVKGVGGRGC